MSAADKTTASSPPYRRWLRRAAYAAATLALLMLVAWLAVPPVVRAQLESRLTETLGRSTTVEAVVFDPFRLRLTVRNLAIAGDPGSAPLLAVDELVANLSAASLWHRAPVLDALKLVRPRVALVRARDGRYSVQDLIERALSAPPGPSPRFSINNVEIDDGSIAFDDRRVGRTHVVAALGVGIPFVSSLPYETDIHVEPRLGGTVNGTQFSLRGWTTPFAERHEVTLDLDFDALPLPAYVAYSPVRPRFDVAAGALTTRLKIVFVNGKPGERRLELRGTAQLDGLAIKRRDGSSLAAAKRIAVAIDRIDLLGHDARLASVTIDAPVVDAKRLADGTLEWGRSLVEPEPRASATRPDAGAAPEPPWSLAVGQLALAGGVAALADESTGFRSTLVDVALNAANLSTRPGEKARVSVAFVSSDRIASFSGEADVEPMVPAATGRFALAKFSLGLLFPYYRSVLAVDVQKGSLDFASAFALDAAGDLRLSAGEATLADVRLALPGSRDPLWRVPQLTVRGIDVDVRGRHVVAEEMRGRDAALRLARDADGGLEMARFLKTTAKTGTAADGGTWTLLTRKLALERIAIDLEDRVQQPPVRLAVRELAGTATNLTNARGAGSEVSVRARVGERGRVAFAGPVTSNPLSASGEIEVAGFPLAALKPYVEARTNVVLTGGTLSAKGRGSIVAPDDAAVRASWKGSLSIADFGALDKPTASDLVRWKALVFDRVDAGNDPPRVAVERIGLEDFFARVIVHPDGSLNLVQLVAPDATPQPTPGAGPQATPGARPPPTPGAKPALPGAGAAQALPVTIGRIEFAQGNVNFSDFFIKPNYSANLTDVAGSVSTMSAEQAGDVAMVARVAGTAPVEVQGRIHPFAAELSLDVTAKARDIDLPPLTPYSLKYAGYGIEKGKLAFEVHYQLENRKLSAQNRLVLDQLTFGEHVPSPTATTLPVRLAVALLKDSRGVIDVRLPISGSLDDPKFSFGGLIVQVIVNLLTRAATAPFALLSAALGGGEELSTLTFAAGRAAIGEEVQGRVDTLAKALADRPGVKLEIGGRADPVADREALRHMAVETALKREKTKSLAADGGAPASVDEVTLGPEERSRWLAAAYRAAPLPDRPRNAFGMLKDVPPAEMEAMLFAHAQVDDESLRMLANARAQSVKDALVAKGVASERLFLVAPRLGSEPGGAPAPGAPTPAATARVDLALR